MKYQKRIHWDKHRPEFLKIGFIFALAITFTAFNYTTNPPVIEPYETAPEIEDFLIIPPTTAHVKKALPPPPKPKVVLAMEFEIEHEPIIKFDQKIEINENVKTIVNQYANEPVLDVAPIVELVKEEDPEVDTPLLMAERMPIYGSCNVDSAEDVRRDCTNQNLIEHIYKNVKYPALARDYETEGTVVVSFVVNKEGEVEQVKILRDIGMKCGEEVKRVINELGRFLPGKQNGRPVSVIYRLPVKFSLR